MSWEYPRSLKKRWLLHCSPSKAGTTNPPTFLPPREPRAQPSWAKFPMFSRRRSWIFCALVCAPLLLALISCGGKPDSSTLTMIIESSPTNLDPRVGIDAYSERIDNLIFDGLLTRDEHFQVQPGLAERWEIPDPLTYIFHLRHGVRFHDGQPLTSRDVKYTFDLVLHGQIVPPRLPFTDLWTESKRPITS